MRWFRRREHQQPSLDRRFAELLDQHGLTAFERQLALAEIAGDRDWQLDMARGVLSLLPGIDLAAQVIGSFRISTHLAVGVGERQCPEAVATQATRLRTIGELEALDIFTTPQIETSRVGDGHLLALVAVGLLDADAYYRCPFAAGEAFVLVVLPERPGVESRLDHLIDVVSTAAGAIPVAVTPAAIDSYFASRGFSVSMDGEGVTATSGAGSARLEFDDRGRLRDVSAHLAPDSN